MSPWYNVPERNKGAFTDIRQRNKNLRTSFRNGDAISVGKTSNRCKFSSKGRPNKAISVEKDDEFRRKRCRIREPFPRTRKSNNDP